MRTLLAFVGLLAGLFGGLVGFAPAVRADEPGPQGHAPDELEAANRAAGLLLAETLRRDRPEDYAVLCGYRPRDLLVVRGAYDHLDRVLRRIGVPFTECDARELLDAPLHGVAAVLVNCPGEVGEEGARRLRRFVDGGGLLFTTDWAVLHVLETAFPGTVRYTRRPTRDDVVSIRVRRPEHLFLKHVLTGRAAHRWWLETSSYPIEVLDPHHVEVLIDSEEMRRKYGSGPIAVTFGWGRGRVVHVVSHAYLQRSELRDELDRLRAGAFAEDLGFAPGSPVARRLGEEGLAQVAAGELRSAYSAQQLLANLLIEAKRASTQAPEVAPVPTPRPQPPASPPERAGAGRAVAARDTALREAPEGASFRAVNAGVVLQILARRAEWVEVATPSGAVGWLRRGEVREAR